MFHYQDVAGKINFWLLDLMVDGFGGKKEMPFYLKKSNFVLKTRSGEGVTFIVHFVTKEPRF